MRIELLNKEQITKVYNTKMVHDFPSTELKPLRMILEGYDQGKYFCYGLVEDTGELNSENVEDMVLGYAVFVKRENHYLFDYLGVSKEKRNGYVDTGVRVVLFGVDYIVLEMDLGKNHDEKTISELYYAHYKTMLPEKMFLEKVKVKAEYRKSYF